MDSLEIRHQNCDNAVTNFPLTCAGIEDGNIGELVQLIELDVSLSLFTVVIYLLWKKMHIIIGILPDILELCDLCVNISMKRFGLQDKAWAFMHLYSQKRKKSMQKHHCLIIKPFFELFCTVTHYFKYHFCCHTIYGFYFCITRPSHWISFAAGPLQRP